MQQLLDPLWGRGARNHMKAGYLGNLGSGAIDALLRGWEAKPSPMSELHVHHMGGAAARVAGDSSAFPHRDAPYVANFISRWTDAETDDEQIEWGRDVYSSLAEHTTGGAYINFLSDEGQDRVRAAYGDERLRRGCRRSSATTTPTMPSTATRTSSPRSTRSPRAASAQSDGGPASAGPLGVRLLAARGSGRRSARTRGGAGGAARRRPCRARGRSRPSPARGPGRRWCRRRPRPAPGWSAGRAGGSRRRRAPPIRTLAALAALQEVVAGAAVHPVRPRPP